MLSILLGVFYAIWLGAHALFTPDEGRYSEVAREMVVSGDYVTPRLNGVPFLDKPIFYYWLQASAIQLFGLKEWALRFWPAFIGVLGCLLVYGAGRQFFNRRTGVIAAILLSTSPLYYGAAHYANLDLEVAVLIGNSLLFFLLGMESSHSKMRSWFLFFAYVFMGLAALTKGLIGIVFPAMIIGSWILILNRWSILKEMRIVTGAIIFSLITVPWYVLVQKANPQFFHFFFVVQQFSRYLTQQSFNNQTSFWFYIPIIFAGFFPWSIFCIQSLWQSIKNIFVNRQEYRVELFLLLWVIFVFIFFSIPKSKTVGYILPLFQPLALLVGCYFSRAWERAQQKGIQFGLLNYVLISVATFVMCWLVVSYKWMDITPEFGNYIFSAGGLFLFSGILIFFLRKKNLQTILSCLITTAVLFLFILSASSQVSNVRSIKPLAMELKSLIKPDDEVVTFYRYYQDLPIYIEKRIVIVADWKAPDIAQNDNWLRELWYGMNYQDTSQWLIDEATFWTRWKSDKRLYVLTEERYLDKLREKAVKYYQIAQTNSTVLISNHPV